MPLEEIQNMMKSINHISFTIIIIICFMSWLLYWIDKRYEKKYYREMTKRMRKEFAEKVEELNEEYKTNITINPENFDYWALRMMLRNGHDYMIKTHFFKILNESGGIEKKTKVSELDLADGTTLTVETEYFDVSDIK